MCSLERGGGHEAHTAQKAVLYFVRLDMNHSGSMGVCPANLMRGRTDEINYTLDPTIPRSSTHTPYCSRDDHWREHSHSASGWTCRGTDVGVEEYLSLKPALSREDNFYEHLSSYPVLAPLRRYIPKLYGALRFEGKVKGGNSETLREALAAKEGEDKCPNLGCD